MTAGALVIERTRTGRVSLVALLLVVACSGRRKTDVAVVIKSGRTRLRAASMTVSRTS